MDQEQVFLQALLENPRDLALRPIFADWLEEHGDPRGELLRLSHLLTQDTDQPNRTEMEDRLRSLLEAGVQPVGPFWTNSIGMRFAWIPPGVFLMGSPEMEAKQICRETQRRVRLTKGLWLGVYPVTQAQWQAVMGNNPSDEKGEHLPVGRVSWYACRNFCTELSQRTGNRYTVPTEAEWEYACRAGTTTPFHFGVLLNGTQANCRGDHPCGTEEKGPWLRRATAVGSYPPNAWGLHDMHGNVWEWCEDYWAPFIRVQDPEELADPVNRRVGTQERRVQRGGSWLDSAWECRAAHRRVGDAPGDCVENVGLRIALRVD
jgi:uncharacterized protein (TIGR02996 family)